VYAISHFLKNTLKRAAPTAKAAFLINCETIHSLFNISPNHEFKDLSGKKLKDLQELFREVKFILIDEFSMMSQSMLAKIDSRLRQAKNVNEFFEGISVILTGDPGQLLPVSGTPLYYDNPASGLAKMALIYLISSNL
jgi:ATP-dependent exoDNAse (exonuclease V) alpha subunit